MNFEEVLPALKEGKEIIRPGRRILFIGKNYRGKPTLKERDGDYEWHSRISFQDLLATDWEILEDDK